MHILKSTAQCVQHQKKETKNKTKHLTETQVVKQQKLFTAKQTDLTSSFFSL